MCPKHDISLYIVTSGPAVNVLLVTSCPVNGTHTYSQKIRAMQEGPGICMDLEKLIPDTTEVDDRNEGDINGIICTPCSL